MTSTCPTCGKPVDALRARSVGVRDGKIVAFCSTACASGTPERPAPAEAPSPAPRDAKTSSGRRATKAAAAASSAASSAASAAASSPRAESAANGEPRAPDRKDERKDDRKDERKDDRKDERETGGAERTTRAAKTATETATKTEPEIETATAREHHTDERTPSEDRVSTSERRDEPAATRSVSRPLVWVLAALLGTSGAYLAYRFLFAHPEVDASTPHSRAAGEGSPASPVSPTSPPGDLSASSSVSSSGAAPGAAATDPTMAPSPEESVARAREVLSRHVESGEPRVARSAAAALARTGDPKALEVLAAALASEPSEGARLELAYALARGGERRGVDALVAGLRAERRDVRAEAGRLLALLGDERATRSLVSFLGVTQLRLGAAEQLAYLRDQRGIAVLDAVRADPAAKAADRTRATIALGVAGRTDVQADLVALLQDARFNAFAAAALAQLGDPAARPVLVEQLAIPALRVDAARSLRRLDPSFDPAPHLPALLDALGRLEGAEQVQTAEAILLLAGEPGWSARP